MRRQIGLIVSALLLTGCIAVRAATIGGPPAGAFACGEPAEFSFIGETSLTALGLGGEFGGPDADRIGSVWVSTGAGDPGGKVPGVATRTVCVQWDDGGSLITTVDPNWQPPGSLPTPAGAGGLPVPILVLGGGAVVIIGFSIFAFRRDSPGAAS